MKENLLVSFSGGRTSAYMAHCLKENFSDKYNLVYVFANTGQEREETLDFVNKCDKYLSLDLIWVEALVYTERGKGTKYTITDYDSADRSGVNFEAVIKKYGIPNVNFPHCTRELKQRPINAYAKKTLGEYTTAIGIRGDEYRRVKKNQNKFVYPLADWVPVTKQQVNDFWSHQPFNLELEDHQGNCSWCWKKSFKKLFMLIDETPWVFDFPKKMEALHSSCGPSDTAQVFFRGIRSTDDLFKYHKEDRRNLFDLGIDDGCSESCEMYETV
jgi:7-cyano-7-deazaguanine synthase in queuosine biosynthesis